MNNQHLSNQYNLWNGRTNDSLLIGNTSESTLRNRVADSPLVQSTPVSRPKPQSSLGPPPKTYYLSPLERKLIAERELPENKYHYAYYYSIQIITSNTSAFQSTSAFQPSSGFPSSSVFQSTTPSSTDRFTTNIGTSSPSSLSLQSPFSSSTVASVSPISPSSMNNDPNFTPNAWYHDGTPVPVRVPRSNYRIATYVTPTKFSERLVSVDGIIPALLPPDPDPDEGIEF
ncbi:16025_t:CDS:2 [Entrophospora sp. SA101]|nr:1690_t:CDS:2 [Entrophospora sp. SA101]CAJ0836167.1 1991_t:CDS:2 [Entrophospora sp. SA101]CAJ0839033.1 16025_t:CDS:2 [Entrophospora sp. SA101]